MQNADELTRAAYEGDSEAVVNIAKSGCSLDAVDGVGHTPLTAAVEGDRLAVVCLLLKLGADPNGRGFRGWTPLHAAVDTLLDSQLQGRAAPAADEVRLRIVTVLAESGAEPDLRDDAGSTPLSMVEACGATEIVSRILAALQREKARE